MLAWLKRLFLLAVISGAAFAVWTALRRRNEIAVSAPDPMPAPPPAPTPPPATPASVAESSERWLVPVGGACPDGYPVKVAKSGIYHLPGGRSYERTAAERCYMSADDAEADGYRRAKA